MKTNSRTGQSAGARLGWWVASAVLVVACGGNGDTGGGAGVGAAAGTGGGAGAMVGTGGDAAGAATGGTGGLPAGAMCMQGESMFALCGANFLPGGDCICDSAYEWACPQVGCNPCPAERVDPTCDAGTDSGAVLYAKEPGGAAHCCTYTNPCAAPEGWSVYAAARECMRAPN